MVSSPTLSRPPKTWRQPWHGHTRSNIQTDNRSTHTHIYLHMEVQRERRIHVHTWEEEESVCMPTSRWTAPHLFSLCASGSSDRSPSASDFFLLPLLFVEKTPSVLSVSLAVSFRLAMCSYPSICVPLSLRLLPFIPDPCGTKCTYSSEGPGDWQ